MAALSEALTRAGRQAAVVDRTKLATRPALRVALGVTLPLALGTATGETLFGVVAAIGALVAGFASLQGVYRTRVGLVLAAAGAMAVSTFVGSTVAHLELPEVLLVAAWGLAAGILVVFGPAVSIVGVLAVVGLVVFSQFSVPVVTAAEDSGFVVAGGLLQALLVMLLWPLRIFSAERSALGSAYEQLAADAATITEPGAGLLEPAAFEGLGPALRDPQPFAHRDQVTAYQGLADQAERIRLQLAALARAAEGLDEVELPGATEALRRIGGSASAVLAGIATSLRRGTPPQDLDTRSVDPELAGTPDPAAQASRDTGTAPALAADQVHSRAQDLAGTLRWATELAAVAAGDTPGDPRAPEPGAGRIARSMSRRLADGREDLAVVAANLRRSSEAGRHALRLAVSLAIAVALGRLLPLGHGYWVPMTTVLVLKPDFTTTFSRGIARIAGTLAGAGAVTLLLAELRPGPDALIVVVAVTCWLGATVLQANYAVFSFCIAALVVSLLTFLGEPGPALAADRVVDTAIGALLALVAYLAWPTWSRSFAPERLARLVEVEGSYGHAVLAAWADPAGVDRRELQRIRVEARRSRSEAQAVVSRWLAEPARDGALPPRAASGILAEVRRYVHGVLALHAALPAGGRSRPELAELADGVDDAMHRVGEALRTGKPGRALPTLRALQLRAAPAIRTADRRPGEPGADAAALLVAGETDRLVNAVDTLAALVGLNPDNGEGRQLADRPPPRPGPGSVGPPP